MKCVHARKIYTGKTVVEDRYLVLDGKKVVGVSPTKKGEVLTACHTLTPAFIDAHNHIGLWRAGEPEASREINDYMDSILAISDVLDSVQMDDESFLTAVEMGVLYSCVLPGSLNLIGGKSAIIRNYAANSTEALITRAGTKGAIGWNPISGYEKKGQRSSTRMGGFAILRKRYDEVRKKIDDLRKAKGRKKSEITFTREEGVLRDILLGRERVRVHAHKTDDIAALLRLVDEFHLQVSVEHAMDVNQIDIFVELKKRGIPVIYGPMDCFSSKVELLHKEWRNVRHLVASGVKFGLMTDHPVTPISTLFLQTRWFLRAGLTRQDAVELVTRKNAEILGIDKILGTLEKGKWASFTCWNGDPFAMDSYPVGVYGEGRLLFSE